MDRVLVTGAANIGKAGVATIVFKWGQHFDSNKLVYDYLMQSGLPEQKYIDAINSKGGKIYTINNRKKGPFSIINWITKIVRDGEYKTIHINSDSAYIAAAYIYAAKRGGIKNIYVHSHCTQIDDNRALVRTIKVILHKLCMPYVKKNSKMYLACSEVAGEWMFGKDIGRSPKYKIIYNGVEADRYAFNESVRMKYRKELGIDDYVVIGNIGRFSFQKNHDFLIDIFSAIKNGDSKYKLLLVGTGELEESIRAKVRALGLDNDVLFLGQRGDVPELLSAMDVFVMPSRFEGLPVTMVEAQMSSLPCVVSDNITREAKFIEAVSFLHLDMIPVWETKIEEYSRIQRSSIAIPKNSPFNIRNAAFDLEGVILE